MAGTSEKDIKLLWGRAAGRCSYCQCDLTHIMDGLGNYHVGEMAHVIGKKKVQPGQLRVQDLIPMTI